MLGFILREVNISKKRNRKLENMDKFFAKDWYAKTGLLSEDIQSDTGLTYVVTMQDYIDYLYRKHPTLYKKLRRPSIVVNGFPISGEIYMNEVVFVKVFENYPWNKTGTGAIVFYTTGPNGRNRNMGKAFNLQTLMGYVDIKVFYNPLYPTYQSKLSSDFDDRRTLYWNPMREVSSQAAKLEFYNSSVPKGYWITIQGVSKNGKIIFYQKHIEKANKLAEKY